VNIKEGISVDNKDYFEKVAPQWDKLRENFFSKAVREKAFQVAEIEQNKLAADIGAGTGFITEGLIEKGLRVIVVDQSEAMLTEMRRKFASFKGIDYRVGEVASLPIFENAVDYVFANMCLHHVELPLVAIKEMVRILKPGGKLIITDLDEHNFEFLKTEQHDRWMGFKREDIKRWFTEAGLINFSINCVGENCCSQSINGNEYATISIFVASGMK